MVKHQSKVNKIYNHMSPTIFLSFLGTSDYIECNYEFDEGIKFTTKYTQIAIILKHREEIDKCLFFLTDESKKRNWGGEGKLESELKNHRIEPSLIESFDIPNGFDNEQLREIFHLIVTNIPENASLIIDVTHSFRSLPITLSSVLEYLKRIKNVSIQSIYYGAFEALGTAKETKEMLLSERNVKILNITFLSAIQDWTSAIEHFLKFGNVTKLHNLSLKDLKPILAQTQGKDEIADKIRGIVNFLNSLLEALYTCRSPYIFKKLDELTSIIQKIDYITEKNYLLPQLNEPFKKFRDKISSIQSDNKIYSTIKLVEWCIDFQWIQQGYTLLQESLISYLLKSCQNDYMNEENRNCLSSALNLIYKQTLKEKRESNKKKIKEYFTKFQEHIELAKLYHDLSQYRNDINHAGYNDTPMSSDKFKSKLKECYHNTIEYLNKNLNKSC